MTDLTRRQYLGGVAALAASRWENEDYDIQNVENWEPLGTSLYVTGEITPDEVTASADGEYGRLTFNDDDFTERLAQVTYWTEGVSLEIEAKGDGNVRAGQLTGLTTDEARELATILFQAAEELDRRREVDDADE
ncbi:hypothetical protein [Salarchaeum sp. JOR-1]|uniref:hypothetical protein n=1 Tax=Salarchaeum sp. JOR-1 TaxID=2599399 RepID=UPI0011984C73|nr:hypothetical protein [Salarchaeum sp. JOR-1]QDX41784.1 hypothetical protein FQU85_13040 [Salarchaeum sp. JOR-1]